MFRSDKRYMFRSDMRYIFRSDVRYMFRSDINAVQKKSDNHYLQCGTKGSIDSNG